jgi:hypothetical protein
LVLFPVQACANLNDLYVTAAKNKLYASQGRAATNDLARRVRTLFDKDSLLSLEYNLGIADGKWNHMMDQTHIGYTYWQEPPHNNIPAVVTLDPDSATGSSWGVAIEGSPSWWPGSNDFAGAILPAFNPFQSTDHYIDIFNRRSNPFTCTIRPGAPWIQLGSFNPQIEKEQRVWINIDWTRAPSGSGQAPLLITGPDGITVTVRIKIDNPVSPKPGHFKGFVETNGYVSMEAPHYTRSIGAGDIQWLTIPDLGRTGSGIQASPVTSTPQTPGRISPRLEYQLFLFDTGSVKVDAYFSPILAFNREPIRYAISIDDEAPQTIDLSSGNEATSAWNKMVADNIRISVSTFLIKRPGIHVLKYWLVDAGPVLQKIVLDVGGALPSYLGPPESPTGN